MYLLDEGVIVTNTLNMLGLPIKGSHTVILDDANFRSLWELLNRSESSKSGGPTADTCRAFNKRMMETDG